MKLLAKFNYQRIRFHCIYPQDKVIMHKLSRIMFDKRDHGLLAIVNDVLNRKNRQEYNKRKFFPFFHPHGIKKMAEPKELRIAYAVIHLLESLEAGQQDERIGALRALRDEVLNASEGAMPRNTARALLQIMKELVRTGEDEFRQLQLAHDFRVTASGKPRIVRRQLRRHHLLEMPEAWNQLAFDDHVHDINTKGRKSATHLIMDAWLKGIRRLRVVYYNYIQAQFAAELLEAADIMGIEMRIGIEFAVRFRSRYAQLIWVPRGFIDTQSFLCFLAEPQVQSLMEEGYKVSEYRQKEILQVLDIFNRQSLPVINTTYGIHLDTVSSADFLEFVKPGQASLLHLAKFIHGRLLPELQKRGADLQSQHSATSSEEKLRIETLVSEMNRMDSETILDCFLSHLKNNDIPDTLEIHDEPGFPSLLTLPPHELLQRLVHLHTGYRITLTLTGLHPADVLEILYDCEGLITRLESFNLKDYASGKTAFISEISRLQSALNDGNVITLKRLIRTTIDQIAASVMPDKADRVEKLTSILNDIHSLRVMYKGTPLKSRIGSDSTGQSPRMHGMGLAVMDSLPRAAIREIAQSGSGRMIIPFRMTTYYRVTHIPRKIHGFLLSRLYEWMSNIPGVRWLIQEHQIDWIALEHTTRMETPGNIVTLGGIHENAGNQLYINAPPDIAVKKPPFSLNYMNTLTQNILKMTIGFIPAFLSFALRYNWWVLKFGGAFIWFGITGVRNILQSILGGGGLQRSPLLGWRDYVNWERISDSLLYTGLSVPLLDALIKTLVLDRLMGITTATSPFLVYTVMALSNGIYTSCHNTFRGFTKTVIAGNFFRNIIGIPVAIFFNAAIGGILSIAGITDIDEILQQWAAVISKAASDFVAGVFEGAADRYQNIHSRIRDYEDKLAKILETYANLEMLFPEKNVLEVLGAMNQPLSGDAMELQRIMMIHALDLLYFWDYQPRGRTAMKMLAKTLSAEERQILLGVLQLLDKQRDISMMFVDGIIGKNFSSALAFYLNNSKQYLSEIRNVLWPEAPANF